VPWHLAAILGAVSFAVILIELHVGLKAGSDKIFRLYGRAWFSAFKYIVMLFVFDVLVGAVTLLIVQPAQWSIDLASRVGVYASQVLVVVVARFVGAATLQNRAGGVGDARIGRLLKRIQELRNAYTADILDCAMVETREYRADVAVPALIVMPWNEVRRDILNFSGWLLDTRGRQRAEVSRILATKAGTEEGRREALDGAVTKLLEYRWGRRYVRSLVKSARRRGRVGVKTSK
jgi:hypothetical protein